MKNFLKDLNKKQREAVLFNDSSLLIFAGAGSGKTKVITYKIAYLIESLLVPSSRILAVTFTNKAANEMKERVEDLIGEHIKGLWIGTFHSMCARILRKEIHLLGYDKNFTILDQDDSTRVIKKAMKQLDINTEYFKAKKIGQHISAAKRRLMDSKEFNKIAKEYIDKIISSVYKEYEKILKESNALDFDDIIMLTVKLLKNHEDVAYYYKDKFKYILVDEYQDINKSQYELLKILAEKHKKIIVVGDDDQSIYSFRGANTEFILSFQENFPNVKTIKLERNYRSPQEILNVANELIVHNRERSEKKLYTKKKMQDAVSFYEAANGTDEARFVIKKIKDLHRDEGKQFSDFAILYRMNAQSRLFEERLLEEGIPYQIIGGVRFYGREEIKDIIAYLAVLNNPYDDINLRRIINVPHRKIGEATMNKIEETKNKQDSTLYKAVHYITENEKLSPATKKLREFYQLMEDLKEDSNKLSLRQLVEEILSRTSYFSYLLKRGVEGENKIENVKEFISVIKEFSETSEDDSLSAFLAHLSLITDIDNAQSDNRVMLMTLHSAKGLEFPVVFLVGMEEGYLPHYRSMEFDHTIEEERRLCYVGITRSQEKLYLTYAYRRNRYGTQSPVVASRFLSEIPKETVSEVKEEHKETKLTEGEKVLHRIWGVGKVLEVHLDNPEIPYAVIDFIKIGKKKLDLRYAPIERLTK
ncbi:MAG: UvrD-helicase domain-containing protein [Caldisericaceae bacterium]|nr:UvrD-helicase domain-containing protein [Caldisericaceae bacterium]